MNSIDNFFGEYRFLSNFWLQPVEYEGFIYPSNEHAYQAAKTLDLSEREKIKQAESAGKAKRMGKTITLRNDWDQVKIDVMRELTYKKFINKDLRKALLKTGDLTLIEGNTWNDTFWGVCKGVGENNLGKILMEARDYYNSFNKVEHRNGNLFNAPEDAVLVHSCNAQGSWSSGVAAQFKKLFPTAYQVYRDACLTHNKSRKLVGRSLLITEDKQSIGCLFTSHHYGKRVDTPQQILEATRTSVTELVDEVNDCSEIHSPKINAGLFKTPWEETEKCIEQIIAGCEKDIKWIVWSYEE